MASNNICESCFSNGKSTKAVKLCTDCAERLCEQCSVSHLGFKAFKSHNLISLVVVSSELPNVKKSCEHHHELLDFYCTTHDTMCCRSCIPEKHQTCTDVLTLEKASANIRNSSSLTETTNDLTAIIQTLNKLLQSKIDNVKRLEKSSSIILKQVHEIKKQLVEKIYDIEKNLIESLKRTQSDVKSDIESSKAAISGGVSKAEKMRQKIVFLEEHGTANQLFMALKSNERYIKTLENDTTAMLFKYPDIDIDFTPVILSIESLGSISQTNKPCDIQYTPSRYKQAQAEFDINSSLTKFKQEGEVVLKRGEDYYLTDLAVTPDNKLILCNSSKKSPKVFTYTDCNRYENQLTFSSPPSRIALIPNTNKAFVTIWDAYSIQFFNYAKMTKEDTIQMKCKAYSIAASSDELFLGGDNEVNVVDMNGIHLKSIPMPEYVSFTKLVGSYNIEILCSCRNFVLCNNLNGDILYKYKVSNFSGIAVDKRANVYIAGFLSNDIQKLSPDLKFIDTVLKGNDGLVNPFSMTFNNAFTKLYVINKAYKAVAIYTCS